MRIGLYPIIAGTLVSLWVLAEIFEDKINNAPQAIQSFFIILTPIIAIGAILLAMWDTKIIGKNKQ